MPNPNSTTRPFESLILIAGLSGAGKSSASRAFSDNGYFAIDNLPISLLEVLQQQLENSPERYKKTSLLVDINSENDVENLFKFTQLMSKKFDVTPELLFLDAETKQIVTRYSQTRRPHPRFNDSSDITLEEAIGRERELLIAIREKANIVIDTSELTPHDLRRQISSLCSERDKENYSKNSLRVNFQSFGFKYGVPTDCDLIVDVRFLPNPYFNEELRSKTGLDTEVQEYVLRYEQSQEFLQKYQELIHFLLPQYVHEGKRYLKIGIGCTGGKHRSVTIATKLHNNLEDDKYITGIIHRDIEK